MTVARHLQQPTRTAAGAGRPEPPREGRTRSCSALLPMGFTEPSRSPGLLVSSYLTVSPLPTGKPAGGLFSVALSLASRPVGVTHHRTLWSPDFPPAEAWTARNSHRRIDQRSPGPLRFHGNRRTPLLRWQAAAGRAGIPSRQSRSRPTRGLSRRHVAQISGNKRHFPNLARFGNV